MEQVTIIGIDISKKSFQLHGATAEGELVFRRTLSCGRLLAFLSDVPSCLVVMEACGGATTGVVRSSTWVMRAG